MRGEANNRNIEQNTIMIAMQVLFLSGVLLLERPVSAFNLATVAFQRAHTFNLERTSRLPSSFDAFEFDDTPSPPAYVAALDAPAGSDYPPIITELGETVPLTDENIEGLLSAVRVEIGTLFGYTQENRDVGITGAVDFVELDGPIVVLKLTGRFWHQRPTVLERVSSYIIQRCPEIVDVTVQDPYELTDEANNAAV